MCPASEVFGSEFEPECSYCGLPCYRECDDPDRCISCWYEGYCGESSLDSCVEDGCDCVCHKEDMDDFFHNFREECDSGYEEMKAHLKKMASPKLQPGVFPFMRLSGELRDAVYYYNLKQHGSRRKSPYFKGTIETALLSTCRQIKKEAKHLPLSINTFSFANPFQG